MAMRSLAVGFALWLAIAAAAAPAAAQFGAPLVVADVQKTANAPDTLDEGAECAAFLQDIQKSPKNFKIANQELVVGESFVLLIYTLDGPVVEGQASQVILTCALDAI